MLLERVSLDNGEWASLRLQWEASCANYSENFEDYAMASMPVLEQLARETQTKTAGVFAYKLEDQYAAACQANSAFLPGYDGRVLRVRHIVFSPKYDFDDTLDISDYAEALIGVFAGATELSNDVMPAQHIKFHLKSPSERQFAELFKKALEKSAVFKSVNISGSWIYLSKA